MQHTATDIDAVHHGERLIDLHRQRSDDLAIDALCAGTPPNEDEAFQDALKAAGEFMTEAKITQVMNWLGDEVKDVLDTVSPAVKKEFMRTARYLATERKAQFLFDEGYDPDEERAARARA